MENSIKVYKRPNTLKTPFFYGYVVVAASVIIQGLAWGMFQAYGVFFNPILTEFSASRAAISASASIAQIMIGVGSIVLGKLTDRFGPRLLVALSGVIVAGGYWLMSEVQAVWQIYVAYGLIVGFGLSGADVILLATTAKWFVRRRGLMTGIVKTGTGIGIVVMPALSVSLILAHGWRSAFVVIAAIFLVSFLVLSQFLRRDPSEIGRLPDGDVHQTSGRASLHEHGLTLRQALRARQFWMMCLVFLATFFIGGSVIIHLPPHVIDLGFTPQFAATLVAASGGTSIAARLLMGSAVDRIGTRLVLGTCLVLMMVSLSFLLVSRDPLTLWVFTLSYGLANGGAFSIMSPVVAEYFGTKHLGVLLGVLIFVGSLGGAAGPLVTGRIFDLARSYQPAFLLLLTLAVFGFALLLVSGKARPLPEYANPETR